MKTKVGIYLFTLLAAMAFGPSGFGQGAAPVILLQPTNRVAVVGGSAVFSITATGAPPLYYRWWKDGSLMPISTNRFDPFVTNRNLVLTNIQVSNEGTYYVVVTNSFGVATSQFATLQTILQKPVILTQPQDAPLCPGGSNSFLNVSASGALPLRYQWRFNEVDIPGAASQFLVIPGSAANIGDYTVVITNVAGAVTSRVARLEPKLIILQNPESRTVGAGADVRLGVVVRTCGAVTYQWRWFGTNLPGANQFAYDIFEAVSARSGPYDVIVTDSYGSVTSLVAQLNVEAYPPVIVSQPQDQHVATSSNAVFWISYSGFPAPSLQWRFNGVDIPGQTNGFISVPILPANEGGYSVVLSNLSGVVTSRVATLTLDRFPPSILPSGQPQDMMLCPPTPETFRYLTYFDVQVVSPPAFPASFQWRHNGTNIPGANSVHYYVGRSRDEVGDYTVVVSNPFGTVTSQVARVILSPMISLQPEDAVEPEGGSAQLNVGVRTCGSVALQWRKNGVDIPRATNSYLNFLALAQEDAGDYSVIVAHYFGAVTSRVARLEVSQEPPAIDPNTPEDRAVHAGDFISFGVAYDSGSPRATFLWRFNGVPMPGETNASLNFHALLPSQQGRYSVVLSNVMGSVTSRLARLTITFMPPFIYSDPQDLEVPDGGDASFYVETEGAPPPSFQWLFNGVPIPGETRDYLSFRVSGTNQVGRYSVIVSNLLGVVTSEEAVLTRLTYPPGFVSQPSDLFVNAGAYVYFGGFVTSAPPASYQWLLNGQRLPRETNDSLQFVAGFSNQLGGYSLVASNELGSVTSRVAILNISIQPPSFSVQPVDATAVAGQFIALSAYLANNIPAFFQWHRNGLPLFGATNNVLVVRSATTNDTGDYFVVARNDAGRATSQVARLDVRLSGALDRWTWRRPLPQGNPIYDVAYGSGRHVAVGEAGAVVISTNGTNWFDASSDTMTREREGIAYGNGVFVALEDDDYQISTNGVDWEDRVFGQGFHAHAIAFGNGRFVIISHPDRVAVSTNGVDWEFYDGLSVSGFTRLSFAGGLFISAASGLSDPRDEALVTSSDGVNWTSHSIDSVDHVLNETAYGGGKFVGISYYYQADFLFGSADGSDWSVEQLPQALDVYPQTIAYGNGVWVIGGIRGQTGVNSGILHSTDAIHWTAVPGVGTNSVVKVLFDGMRFTAVGYYGFLATSANGIDWTVVNPGSDLNLRGVACVNGLFITVGNGGLIYTSTDGREWIRRESGTTGNLRSITFFRDRYIIVGGNDLTGDGIVLVSDDGVHWEQRAAEGSLYGIAHDGQRLVAVGDAGAIATSLDGDSWANVDVAPVGAPSSESFVDLNAVTWTGSHFMAVGKDGTVVRSTNGLNWTSTGPGGGKNLKGIAYGNGLYVAVGNDTRINTSYDGITWFRLNLQPQQDFEDIIFAGGRFVAVGERGLLFSSEDGTNWVRRVTGSDNDFRGITYSEGSYFAVGNNETILQSVQIDAALRIIRPSGTSGVQLEIFAEAGRVCRVQSSSNLTQWDDLLTFTAGAGPTRHTDNSPDAGAQRFYRVISP